MKSTIEKGICTITPELKQIDITNSTSFGLEIGKILEQNCDFLVNLENIGFMDSSGLGKFIEAIRIVKEKDRKIAFYKINNAVKVLFAMVNLSQITILCDSREEAEARLSQ